MELSELHRAPIRFLLATAVATAALFVCAIPATAETTGSAPDPAATAPPLAEPAAASVSEEAQEIVTEVASSAVSSSEPGTPTSPASGPPTSEDSVTADSPVDVSTPERSGSGPVDSLSNTVSRAATGTDSAVRAAATSEEAPLPPVHRVPKLVMETAERSPNAVVPTAEKAASPVIRHATASLQDGILQAGPAGLLQAPVGLLQAGPVELVFGAASALREAIVDLVASTAVLPLPGADQLPAAFGPPSAPGDNAPLDRTVPNFSGPSLTGGLSGEATDGPQSLLAKYLAGPGGLESPPPGEPAGTRSSSGLPPSPILVSGSSGAHRFDAPTPLDDSGPLPGSPTITVGGSGASFFVPLAALLALLALAAPAILRRLREVSGFPAPIPFVCALERPG